jgi:hypothetical protein
MTSFVPPVYAASSPVVSKSITAFDHPLWIRRIRTREANKAKTVLNVFFFAHFGRRGWMSQNASQQLWPREERSVDSPRQVSGSHDESKGCTILRVVNSH